MEMWKKMWVGVFFLNTVYIVDIIDHTSLTRRVARWMLTLVTHLCLSGAPPPPLKVNL